MVHALVERRTAAPAGGAPGAADVGRSSGRAERAKNRKARTSVPKTKTPSTQRYALTSYCADREQEADRAERHGRRAAQPSLEEDGARDDRRPPGMPTRRLDDPHRIAAERRRKDLSGRVGDEVRARQPRQALVDAVCARGAAPAQREAGTVTTMIATASANQARSVSARTSSVVSSSTFQTRYATAASGQDERPDHRVLRVMTRRPRASRGDGTNLAGPALALARRCLRRLELRRRARRSCSGADTASARRLSRDQERDERPDGENGRADPERRDDARPMNVSGDP